MPAPHLAELLTLFSPAFPIGAFAWSHGLEAAVAERILTDGPSVEAWVRVLLDRGSGWNDFVLLAEAYEAHRGQDEARIAAVAELAEALAGSAERRAESLALGAAFAEAAQPWASGDAANDPEPGGVTYPVAVGRLAAGAGFELDETLLAFAHGFAAALVSAAVRLVPLAQSEAVRILRRLEPDIRDLASRAARSTLDDLGSAALGSDIAAMRHETLPTRLFRS
ncbi:urease accessory UreF family protein [Aurantimonas sp. A2-1-M11]